MRPVRPQRLEEPSLNILFKWISIDRGFNQPLSAAFSTILQLQTGLATTPSWMTTYWHKPGKIQPVSMWWGWDNRPLPITVPTKRFSQRYHVRNLGTSIGLYHPDLQDIQWYHRNEEIPEYLETIQPEQADSIKATGKFDPPTAAPYKCVIHHCCLSAFENSYTWEEPSHKCWPYMGKDSAT